MNIDFNVYNYDYNKRDGNLTSEAKGKVKSKKQFPFFYQNGKKIIFKPLSKTKPFSTPYFAYSEVAWSNLLNNYFDSNIPIYYLAKCHGYEEEVPKYHNYGTIVESIVNEDERLINLYEYFEIYKDSIVNISDYINFCLKYYDYSFFFESKLFKENEELARNIAIQILYSILRADQNYHYENVSLVFKNDTYKRVAMPIDHEFSTMFMYLDQNKRHNKLFEKYKDQFKEKVWEYNNIKNIKIIKEKFPDLVQEFLISLDNMINDLKKEPIQLKDYNFLEPFSSDDFEEGYLRYKENKIKEANEVMKYIKKKFVSPEEISERLNQEILENANILKRSLQK